MCGNTGNTSFLVVTQRPYQVGTSDPMTLYVPQLTEVSVTSVRTQGCGCQHDHCYQPTQESQRDNTAYEIALVGNATKGVFEGIADIIRACKTPASGSAQQAGTSSNTPASGTPASNTSELDALKAENQKLQAQIDELTGKKTQETQNKPVVDTSLESLEESDFAKKWGKIGDNYKNTNKTCEDFKKAVSDKKTDDANKLHGSLTTIQGNLAKDIQELNKALEKGDLSDADKAIGKKALDTLNKLKGKVDDALKLEIPQEEPKVEKPAEEEPKVEKPKAETTEETSAVDSSQNNPAVDLDALQKKAQELNRQYHSALSIQQINPTDQNLNAVLTLQSQTIEAYNAWATAVVDPNNNASTAQIEACKTSMHTVSTGNKSKHVADLVATAADLYSKLQKM